LEREAFLEKSLGKKLRIKNNSKVNIYKELILVLLYAEIA
jgi:hypothetical protein